MQFLRFNQTKGSSAILPAHGRGGVRARKNLSAVEKFLNSREDGSAGGFKGGMPSRPSVVAPPLARLEQSQAKKFSFPLEEKIGGARKIKIATKTFLLGSRAERAAAGRSVRRFAQNRFGFGHIIAPRLNFPIFARPIRPREARKGMETLARRARRGSPNADSKSLAILSICFAQ